MREGWEIKKLGEVCEKITRGISPKYIEKNGTLVLNQKCIRDHKINFDLARLHDENVKSISNVKFLRVGDVLVNSTGEGTLGRVAQVRDLPEEKVTVDSHVSIVRPLDSKFYLDFFGWAMVYIESEIKESGAGASGQTELARTVLENNFLIAYPKSLSEQQRIVALLDETFAAIAKAKANAEQNLKNAKELFESYLQGVFEKKGEGWEENVLQEVCEIKPPKKEAKNKLNDNDFVSFLPMEDLGVCQNVIRPNKERKLKDVEGSYTYFAENDILLAKITPCFENGKLGVAKNLTNGIGFGSSEYIVFRCQKRILSEFLFYFLSRQSFREDGKKYMSGAVGHKRVSKDWIENHIFYFPSSIEEQQTIVRQLDALRAETQRLEAVYEKKLADLEELKKSILQKAFAGELTYKNIAS